MVLKAFWGSLGLPLAAFGGIWGAPWGLPIDHKHFEIRLRYHLGFVCSLLAADDGLGSVDMLFYLLSEPLGVDFELPN